MGKRPKQSKRREAARAPKHPFARYRKRHGHYPRARISLAPRQGDPLYETLHNVPTLKYRVLECAVAPTHIEIRTSLAAHPLTIPIRELDTLIEWLLPLVARMDRTSPPFDPELAVVAQNAVEGEYRQLMRQRSKRPRRSA